MIRCRLRAVASLERLPQHSITFLNHTMDRKSIAVLAASFLLLLIWYPLMNRLYPPKPSPVSTNSFHTATNTLSRSMRTEATDVLRPASPLDSGLVATPAMSPQTPETLMVVENPDARYTFTSRDGGLKLIELRAYPDSVACHLKTRTAARQLATLNTLAPISCFALLGGEAWQGEGAFRLTKTTNGVRAEKLLRNGLTVVKEFQLASNYLVTAALRLENHTTGAIKVSAQAWEIGTATPIGPRDNALLMGVQWYDGTKVETIGQTWFANRTLGCVPGTPRTEYVGGAPNNVVWAAVYNQFFTMAVVPQQNSPQLVIHRIPLPGPTAKDLANDLKAVVQPFGFEASLLYPETLLAPGQAVERRLEMFAGPKEYNLLARLGAKFGNNLDLVMGFNGFFGFFAKALLLSMNGLHAIGIAYGLAIIVITVIIKAVFWPLTISSTRSMKRMSALQPQMKALQEKYKEDPKKMNQKLMEFMKENKVSPLGGCLPMLLQIPVFFGFYRMLQSAIELRGASFLWACDLSQPDTVWTLPGLNFPVNVFPLIMGVTMLWQARLTPPSPGMDPVQQKIMKYMPMMFMVFLYNFSAGLTLYWTVQNLLTIAQMKLTRTDSGHPNSPARPALGSPAPKTRR